MAEVDPALVIQAEPDETGRIRPTERPGTCFKVLWYGPIGAKRAVLFRIGSYLHGVKSGLGYIESRAQTP